MRRLLTLGVPSRKPSIKLDENEPKLAVLKLDREFPAFHAIRSGLPCRSSFRRGIFVGPFRERAKGQH